MNSLAGRLLATFTAVIALTALLTVGIASRTAALEIRHAADGMSMTGRHNGVEMQVEDGTHIMSLPVEAVVAGVTRAVGLASVLAGVAAFGLALVVVRAVSQPLSRLAAASRRVAAGDLTARAPLSGPTEVANVARAFNQMADTLGEQERLRRTLLNDVAHELRNPLTVLQGQVEALQDGVFPLTVDTLAPLHSQTRHLARLVEDIQTLARADAGHLALERSAVALRAAAAESLQAFAAEAAPKLVTLDNRVRDSLPPLGADARRLRQVLDNLISNALRHTPPGGTVRVDATLEPSGVAVHVTDTGEGIPADELPFVFDRFYRVDRSRARSSGGSGLAGASRSSTPPAWAAASRSPGLLFTPGPIRMRVAPSPRS